MSLSFATVLILKVILRLLSSTSKVNEEGTSMLSLQMLN